MVAPGVLGLRVDHDRQPVAVVHQPRHDLGEQVRAELDLVHRLRVRADGGIAVAAHLDPVGPAVPDLLAQPCGLLARPVAVAVIDMRVVVLDFRLVAVFELLGHVGLGWSDCRCRIHPSGRAIKALLGSGLSADAIGMCRPPRGEGVLSRRRLSA